MARQDYVDYSIDLENIAPTYGLLCNDELAQYLNEFAYSFKYNSRNLTNTQYSMIEDLIFLTNKILNNEFYET